MNEPIEEEGQRRLLEELRRKRAEAQARVDALNAERRSLLRELVDGGRSTAELARWEGVTSWAIGQAIRKSEPSASPSTRAASL